MRKSKGIMAIDQGTTSSRAVVFAHDGRTLGSAQESFVQHYPQPGWVEHDPEEIWQTQLRCCRLALERSGLEASDLAGIGLANQRETVLLWDAETGEALGNAVVWQCRRTAERCAHLEASDWGPRVAELSGLRLDPYFSASKLEWLLAERPGAGDLLRRRRLRAGTIDSFLIWRLTGGRHHVTDFSNASRTMLLDIHRLEWAGELLDLFGVPESILPILRPSSGFVAETRPELLGAPVPIAGIVGDQQAALFGQGGLKTGDSKNTYGTGCFLLVNTGDRPAPPEHGLLSTVAWVLGSGDWGSGAGGPRERRVAYALEGSVFMAGGAVQWLRDGLGLLAEASEIGPLAAQVPDTGDVYFVPALTGLGAPYWDPGARGLLIGLTRGTTRQHIARATEEAVCFQTAAVLDAMSRTARVDIRALRVDGGGAADDMLLQLQADLAGLPVIRPRVHETTALGAAALCGLAVGYWSEAEIADLAGQDAVFEPRLPPEERRRQRDRWEQAVTRARGWTA
jgi:glycerol kinase